MTIKASKIFYSSRSLTNVQFLLRFIFYIFYNDHDACILFRYWWCLELITYELVELSI
jgi:hypothetical protein